jgi:hypothetical protein
MKRTLVLLVGAILLLLSAAAQAETITLTDGRVIQGQLTRQGDQFLIQPDQGASFLVPVSDLASISLSGPANPQQDAIDKWQYTQYLISRQADLAQIISMLQNYIKQYPDSPNLKDAQAALAQYQYDQAQGYVKFSGKWMAQADVKALQDQIQALIADAIKSFRAGALVQAQSDAQKVLAIDSTNNDAMIVVGVAQYRLNNMSNALQQFNQVLNQSPNNVIALNDTAVVLYQLNVNTQPRALAQYQTALNLASGNRLLLDNIAAALQDYQGDTTTFIYKNMAKSFTAADQQMQVVMGKQGLYRFASTWVNADQRRQLDAQMQAYQRQKNVIQASYDNAQNILNGLNNQLANISQNITQMQQTIQQLQTPVYLGGSGQSFYQNNNNQVLIAQDQQQLAQMQQQQQQLQTQQIQCQTQIQSIQIAAKQLIKSGQAQGFNGIQLMMLPGDLTNVPLPLPLSVLSQSQNPSIGGRN